MTGPHTLGVGIVGAGKMGLAHADVFADHPSADIVAVTSRSPASAQTLAAKGVDIRVAEHVDDLVADPAVQIVVITTPDHVHADVVEAAAAAGKHVLIEKPFTTSAVDADRALAAVRRAGVKAMTLFNHRWVPSYAQAQQRIAAGDIGRPRVAYTRKNDRIFVPTEMLSWADRTTCAWFLSSHDIDLVCWMFDDEPVQAFATAVHGQLTGRGIDTPDAVVAQVRFAGGSVATFESSWIYPNTFPTMVDSFVEIIGERGVIHLDRKCEQIEIATEELFEYPRNLLLRNMHGLPAGAYRDAIWHFVDCVARDREPLVTLESSRQVSAVLEAIHASVASGRVEPVAQAERLAA